MRYSILVTVVLSTILCGVPIPSQARNVDLSTVPNRDTVQLTIYNSEDLTLVRETRKVSFKRGANPLQFSWANTLIDPTSVELRFLTDPDKHEVLDTTFPHDKPQMLYWNVQSELDGEATIEITYFTSGITWSADYVCVADAGEKTVRLDGFVRVTNNSGEEYEDAQVRLVVGKINLVEQIAQLARVSMDEVLAMPAEELSRRRMDAAKKMVADAMPAPMEAPSMPAAPKEIVKEGLSEYFIFTIEGTETIANGWSKRMRAIQADQVPLEIEYRYREPEYGAQLVRMYLMRNDDDSKLGTTPLPDGTVRVFRDNARDGLTYLTEQSIHYIPIGDRIELNLGADPEVIFELIKLRTWRDTIWMQIHGADVFREVGKANVEIDVRSTVVGWSDYVVYSQRVRNYSKKPIRIEVRRTMPGHVVFRSSLEPTLHDYQTVQYKATIDAAEKADLFYEIVQHQGRNAKQNNVTLEQAKVER